MECGLCSLQDGDETVDCDDCPQSMGISEASIAAILSEGDGGSLR